MARPESETFLIHHHDSQTSTPTEKTFVIREKTDTAAGPQMPFEYRRQTVEQFDQEIGSDVKVAEEVCSQPLESAKRFMLQGEYQVAEGLLRSVLRVESKNVAAIRGLAECLRTRGKHEEAIQVLRQLVSVRPSAEEFLFLADELYAMNYNEEALANYLTAMSAMTHDSRGLFHIYKNVGNLLLRLGDPNGAEEYYNRAYTLDPESDVLLVNFGSLAMYRGDLEKALTRFREAVRFNDRSEKAWAGLAMIHREYGDSELAWANVEKALDIDPGNDAAIKLVCDWAMRDNEIDKALVRIDAYLTIHDQDAFMSMMLAKFLFFAGRLSEAAVEAKKSLHLDPNLEEAIDVLRVIDEEIKSRAGRFK